jgi:2-phosphosulfolactate phosphatase
MDGGGAAGRCGLRQLLPPHDVHCEWGPAGVAALAGCRTFIVVDVLSFSTCVSVAADRGALVLPCRTRDEAPALAAQQGAVAAGQRGDRYSLSPASLLAVAAGFRLVLPSPNGATVSLAAARLGQHVLVGSLRNRAAVCARAALLGGPFAVIPAGERWPDGSLRVALEDLAGAGAVVAMLPGRRSPEAAAAELLFGGLAPRLHETIAASVSGRELIDSGFSQDVALATALDAGQSAPQLIRGLFTPQP